MSETLGQRRQRATRDWDTTGNYYRNLHQFERDQRRQQQPARAHRQSASSSSPSPPACARTGLSSAASSGSQQGQEAAGADDDDLNNRTTDCQTMMHILKANIGTGVLAMPMAFGHVGLWLGLALVPLIGAICIHCMNILIASHNRICDRFNYESLDYDQVAALSLACGPRPARRLARWASLFVTAFLMLTQLGFCCVYTLFAVENIQLAMYNLFALDYSTATYLAAVFPVIGLASCTSNLKHLARISTLANVLQLTGLALIFYDLLLGATDGRVRVEQAVSADIGAGLPLFFATAVYAFEGIGVVLPLVKEMQQPARIAGRTGVLNTAMSLVALLYMAMGFFGYAKYGQLVAGSITLNLPETTLNELVRLTFAMAIGLSYSLQFYVPWTIVWPLIDESLFYSYRPRAARDKLDILNKLSAENQWALNEAFEQEQREQERQQLQHHHHQSELPDSQLAASLDMRDCESNASTFASSYSCSVALGAQQAFGKSHRFHLSSSLAGASYGAIQQQLQLSGSRAGQARPARRPRNRLQEVMEQESDGEGMPEVQWRPPPRSMRGKRKLVRYTVILLAVSFTFVAAALIPRLDLFISLIGALASSCLAIIFPAIIQLCAFWNQDMDEDRRERDADADADGASATGKAAAANWTPAGWRARRRQLAWCLFALKNLFLVVFGLVGLVTGSWISLSQLGYPGIT